MIINGLEFSTLILNKVSNFANLLKLEHNIVPNLKVILLGDNSSSKIYVNNKQKKALASGIDSETILLPESTTESELLSLITKLNDDISVNGILVQLPLPSHIDKNIVINAINPIKDVDGFHNENVGKLVIGQRDALLPCTPQGCMYLIKSVCSDLTGCNAVVIGRSNIVGKPMFHLLLQENCTVTILHSKSSDIEFYCRNADIIVSAVGQPHFLKAKWVKSGAIVIDVGINPIIDENGKTKFTGDIGNEFQKVYDVAKAVTPVPGGVGPMTIAFLLVNTIIATCRQHAISFDILKTLI